MPDRLQFRDAMARVGTSVHIVTTDGKAGVAGITASAVTSVSDDPPTMLICVNRSSHSAPRFFANGVFCINTLAADDQALADDFAGRTGLHLDARFQRGSWVREVSGAPVLTSAIAIFECRIIELRDIATHHVIVGDVLAVRYRKEVAGLGYHDRRYLNF
ncbi:MAG: flavin reductase [Hyphomicrobiales bacterium]|nr:flavin reductase [Hyphomicrobiales bacterium]MDE2113481.1 flavin reductase [Hyphomicrobiales bacterium]